MSDSRRPRRPFKVVALVLAFWIVGNLVQAAFAWGLESGGLVGAEAAGWTGLILGWGLLFLLSLLFRERLDDWLRA